MADSRSAAAQAVEKARQLAQAAKDRAAEAQAAAPAPEPAAKPARPKPEHSPKNKKAMGVPEGDKVTWVPLNLPPEENARLQRVAEVRGVKVAALCVVVLKERLAAMEAELAADAAQWERDYAAKSTSVEARLAKMDASQLEAFAARQRAEVERLNGLIEAARQRADAAVREGLAGPSGEPRPANAG